MFQPVIWRHKSIANRESPWRLQAIGPDLHSQVHPCGSVCSDEFLTEQCGTKGRSRGAQVNQPKNKKNYSFMDLNTKKL